MKKALILLLSVSHALYSIDASWIEENIYKKQEEAERQAKEEEWFKSTLKQSISDKYDLSDIKKRTDEILSKAVPCKTQVNLAEEYNVYIAMTFDLPQSVWIEYSQTLEKIGGCFVVRGLPNDSFNDFAKKVKHLRDRGVSAAIQLNPKMFEKFQIDLSPTILLVDREKYDKVSGTVSILYALEQFEKFGDTNKASEIKMKISGGTI